MKFPLSLKNLGATSALCAAALALTTSAASAQLYNIDFGYFTDTTTSPVMSGAAVLGSAGDVWTPYNGGNFTFGPSNTVSVMDSTGSTAAGVTVNATNYITGSDSNPGVLAPNPAPLMQDYLASAGSWATDGWPIKINLAGLPASTPYQLVVFAVGQNTGQSSLIKVTDGLGLTSAVCLALTRDITTGVGDSYQVFNGVTTATGTIYFEVLMGPSNTDGWQAVNGLQLQVVPEPTTIGLCVAGLGMLVIFQRRRRRA